MKEQKQSFLERLTGSQRIENDIDYETRPEEGVPLHDEFEDDGTRDTYSYDDTSEEESDEDEAGLAIDMYESGGELIIQSMIAGVTPENLHISITRDSVTLSGKRIPPEGIPEESYLDRELYWGKFSREITLPYEIDTDNAEAVEKYGLLIIRLPRLDTSKTQELKVRSIE